MNKIILQICHKFITEVMDYFSEGKSLSLAGMEKDLKESSDRFLRDVIKTYLEETDRQIAEDKVGRRKKGVVVERRNEKRSIYTSFGTLTYARSYFFDKQKKAYMHPVDMVVGLEPYDRVSLTVSKDLVGHAAEASYGESSRHVTGGDISRQTVMRKIRKTHGLKMMVPAEKKTVRVLHVDADEDHVAMQGRGPAMIPIVTVYEGIKKLCKNRNRCINPHHICHYGKTPEDLWLKVADWIYDAYEVDSLETIYIHGDGASWIKKSLEILPKSKPVLDKYHLNKAIMSCTGAQPECRGMLRQVLKKADLKRFKKAISVMIKQAGSQNELKRIREFRQYVVNNWKGIVIHNTEECGGSSAEAHVSHVLSARISSRPMAWCREGLKHMAELRAFCANGGVVGIEHLKAKGKASTLVKNATQKAKRLFRKIDIETMDNLVAMDKGKVTPIFKKLRAIKNGGRLLPGSI